MSSRSRPDTAALAALLARCRKAADLPGTLDVVLQEAMGHKLFTLMTIDHAAGEAARVYSSRPDTYPVAGRKPLGRLTDWGRHVIEGRRPWIGRSAADIAWAFYDHELIARLGCASALNVPVIDGGRVIGTVNLLHEAGWYDEADAEIVAPFAALLVPAFRRAAGS